MIDIHPMVSGQPTMPPQSAETTAVVAGISPSDRPGKAVRNALGIVGFFPLRIVGACS